MSQKPRKPEGITLSECHAQNVNVSIKSKVCWYENEVSNETDQFDVKPCKLRWILNYIPCSVL